MSEKPILLTGSITSGFSSKEKCKFCDKTISFSCKTSIGRIKVCHSHARNILQTCIYCGDYKSELSILTHCRICYKCTEIRKNKKSSVREKIDEFFEEFKEKFLMWKNLKTPDIDEFVKIKDYLKENYTGECWYKTLNGFNHDIIGYPLILDCDQINELGEIIESKPKHKSTNMYHLIFPCVKNVYEMFEKCKYGSDRLRYYNYITTKGYLFYFWNNIRLSRIPCNVVIKTCPICLIGIHEKREKSFEAVAPQTNYNFICTNCNTWCHLDCIIQFATSTRKFECCVCKTKPNKDSILKFPVFDTELTFMYDDEETKEFLDNYI